MPNQPSGRPHSLKVVPPYFDALLNGKPFDVRKNDRGFQAGDVLVLHEWRPAGLLSKYTGRVARARVTYVYAGDPRWRALQPGYVVLGIELVAEDEAPLPPVLTDEDRARFDALDQEAKNHWCTRLAISIAEMSLETDQLLGLQEHLRRELGRVGARMVELDKYLAHDRASYAYLAAEEAGVGA